MPVPQRDTTLTQLERLYQEIKKTKTRCIFWVEGQQHFHHSFSLVLNNVVTAMSPRTSFVYIGQEPFESQHPPVEHVLPSQVRQLLGRDLDIVYYDVSCGFSPNTLGIISGCIVGGGLLVLLTPEEPEWLTQNDIETDKINSMVSPEPVRARFLLRFIAFLSSRSMVYRWKEHETHCFDLPVLNASSDSSLSLHQQDCLVDELLLWSTEKACSVALLKADRGRGKSSALGRLSSRLIESERKVGLTAYHPSAVTNVFRFCNHSQELQFFTPDNIINNDHQFDILIIDEAGRIPLNVLVQLSSTAEKIIFSTTMNGYEGTSQSFAIKFSSCMKQLGHDIAQFQLDHPLRWQPGDPLENFFSELLLLKNESAARDDGVESVEGVHFEAVSQEYLVQNEKVLASVYQLLVSAHYQTSPNDLRFMLDTNRCDIFIACEPSNEKVIGVILGVREGHWSSMDVENVMAQRRRFKGEFLPQSLLVYDGCRDAPKYGYGRVVRIAVDPQLQGKGLGTQLLQQYERYLKQHDVDFIGASFGVDQQLLLFWLNNQYQPLRLAQKRDHVSNCFSVNVLKPLREKVVAPELWHSMMHWTRRFNKMTEQRRLKDQLDDQPLLYALLHASSPLSLSQNDLLDVTDFCQGIRLFESCLIGLKNSFRYLVGQHFYHLRASLECDDIEFLIYVLFFEESRALLVRRFCLANQKCVDDKLKALMQQQKAYLQAY